MFKQKNALIAVAVTVLLAACGGGGGSDSTLATSNTTPGGTSGNTNTPATPVQDVALAGSLTLSQVTFNDAKVGVTPAQFKSSGAFGLEAGATAPLKNFGIRVMPVSLPAGGTSGNGHIAIELMDSAAGTPQQIQMMIDHVNYAIDGTTGKWTVTIADTAKLFVHAQNKTGAAATMTLGSVPKTLVIAADIAADPSSHILTVQIDDALTFAKAEAQKAGDAAKVAVFDSLKAADFQGKFNMNGTYSGMTLNESGTGAQLKGADIAVAGSNQTVSGDGVQGTLQIGTSAGI